MDTNGMVGCVCPPLVEGLLPQETCKDVGKAEQGGNHGKAYVHTRPQPGLSPRGHLECDLHLSWSPWAMSAGLSKTLHRGGWLRLPWVGGVYSQTPQPSVLRVKGPQSPPGLSLSSCRC